MPHRRKARPRTSGPPGPRRAAALAHSIAAAAPGERHQRTGPFDGHTLEPIRGNAAQRAVVPIMDWRGLPA